MTPTEADQILSRLDAEHLRALAHRVPSPVFATISGAHLYGFESPDSDIDLRGAFVRPITDVLGLHPSDETVSIMDDSELDLDLVAHDVRKFARMMTQHNGYVLEQLYSPLVVVTSDAHETLRALGEGCITRPTVRHYRGFARGRRERLRQPDPTVKHALYAYRVLLTGIHLMRTGQIESHLPTLNASFAIPGVADLIERKRAGHEKMGLADAELQHHEAALASLQDDLESAWDGSTLPEEPTTTAALEAFVIELRLTTHSGEAAR